MMQAMQFLAGILLLTGCILPPSNDNPRSRRLYRDSAEPSASVGREIEADERDLDERSGQRSSRQNYSEHDGPPPERVVERYYYVPSYHCYHYDCYPCIWYPRWTVGFYWYYPRYVWRAGSSVRIWHQR